MNGGVCKISALQISPFDKLRANGLNQRFLNVGLGMNKTALITGITGQDGVREDLKSAERDDLLKKHGFAAYAYNE